MRISHGITDIDKAAQQLPQGQGALTRIAAGNVGLVETVNGFLEAVSLDEAHGVERPAVGELSPARLSPASLLCRTRCCCTSASSKACVAGVKALCSRRIWPSALVFSSTQACMALTRASRVMKSICRARMPNRRLRSVAAAV